MEWGRGGGLLNDMNSNKYMFFCLFLFIGFLRKDLPQVRVCVLFLRVWIGEETMLGGGILNITAIASGDVNDGESHLKRPGFHYCCYIDVLTIFVCCLQIQIEKNCVSLGIMGDRVTG